MKASITFVKLRLLWSNEMFKRGVRTGPNFQCVSSVPTPPYLLSGGTQLRHHPVLECVAQARIAVRTITCRSCANGGKSTPVLAFVFQHNVGFGQEPDREATGEVLSRYTGPIWPKDWTICLARWLPDCTWTTISLWLVVHLLSFFYRFTKNLSPNKISVKFLKGEGELHNLELDETTLSDLLELPPWIRLTKAVCNRISAKASYYESALLSSLQ